MVNPRGSKLWRVKYRINGVERKLALGSYPEITLAGSSISPRSPIQPLSARCSGGIYRARIGLVTPLRDGMNLVAKEYVAAQDPLDPGAVGADG